MKLQEAIDEYKARWPMKHLTIETVVLAIAEHLLKPEPTPTDAGYRRVKEFELMEPSILSIFGEISIQMNNYPTDGGIRYPAGTLIVVLEPGEK